MEKLPIFCPFIVLRTEQKLGQKSPVAEKVFATILFADISGFTKLSSQLNSEELKKHINDYFSIMVSVVFANGGDVIKFCGDAILIMWTVPVSSERGLKAISVTMACICALQLLKECGRYNCVNDSDHSSINLNLHCGISCGEAFAIILGDECRREFLISGDILSRVGRVEATAKAGEACVCTRVRELVGNKLSCAPVAGNNGAFKLSGKLAQELTSSINSHVTPSHSKSNFTSNSLSVRRSSTSNGDANDDARDDDAMGGGRGGGRELELTRRSFFNDQLANSIAAFSLAARRHSYTHRDSGPATRRVSAAPLSLSSTGAVTSDQSHVPRSSHTSPIDLSSNKANRNPTQVAIAPVGEQRSQHQLEDAAHAMNTKAPSASVSVSTKPRANSVTAAAMNIFRRASISTLSAMLGLGSAAVIPCVDDDDNDNDHQPRVVDYEAQGKTACEPITQLLLFARGDNGMDGLVEASRSRDVYISQPQPQPQPRPRDLPAVKDKEGTGAVGVVVAPRRFSFMMMMTATNRVEADQGRGSSTGSSSRSSEEPRQSFSEIADPEGDTTAAGAVQKYRRHSAGRLKSILLREDDPDVVAMRHYMEQTARLESLNAPRADTEVAQGERAGERAGVGAGMSGVAVAAMRRVGPGAEGHDGSEEHNDHLESTNIRVRSCSEESATSTSTNRCAAVSPEGGIGRPMRNLTRTPVHSRDEISTSEIDSKLFVNDDDVELQSAQQGSGRVVGEETDLCSSSEASAGAGPRRGEGSRSIPSQGDAARPTQAPPSLTNYLRSFVHESARSAIASNTLKLLSETRCVATVFIKINGIDADGGCTSVSTSSSFTEVSSRHADPCEQPQAVLMAILTVTRTIGGSLRQFVLDDKGWVAIVCCGVPGASYDNDCMKAIEASLAIRESLIALGHHSDIGVAYGKTYCGLVGSVTRCEYTVMGASVNLSSRLMAACEKIFGPRGGILIDPEVHHRVHDLVAVVHAGSIFAKGYSAPLDTFTVIGKRCFRTLRLVETEGFPEIMSCLDGADDGFEDGVFDCGHREDPNGSVLQSAGRRGSVLQRLSVLDSIDLVVLKAAAVLGAEEVQQRRVDCRERPAMISLQLLLPTLNGIGVNMTAQDLMSIVLRLANTGFVHAMNFTSSPSSSRLFSPRTLQKRFGDVVGIDWELQEQLYECQLSSQRTLTHRIAGALLEDLYRQSDARQRDLDALLKRSIAHLIMSDCPFTMKMDRLQAAVAIALSERRCPEAIQHLENMIMCVCGLNIEDLVALCYRCFPMSAVGGNEQSSDDSQSLIEALAMVCEEKYASFSDLHMPFTEAAAANGFGSGHVLQWLYAVGDIRHSRLKALSGLQLMALSVRLRGFSMIPPPPHPPPPRCGAEGGITSSSVAPSTGGPASSPSHMPLVDKMRTDSMIASATLILGLRDLKQPPCEATTVTATATTTTAAARTSALGRLLSFSPFATRSRNRHPKAKEKTCEAVVSIEGLNKWLALIEAVATELILRSHSYVAKVAHLLEQGLLICDDCIWSAATGPSSTVVPTAREDMFVDVQGIDEEFHSSTERIMSRRNSFLALLSVAYCCLSHCQPQPLRQAFQCQAATSLALAEALQTQAFSPRALAVLAACKGWRMAHEGLVASAAESFRTASAQFGLVGDTESEQRCAVACAWMCRLAGQGEQCYSSLLDPLRQELSVRLEASKDKHILSSSLPTSSLKSSLSLLGAVARFDLFAAVLDGDDCDDDAPVVACRRFDSIMCTRWRNESRDKATLLDLGPGEAFSEPGSVDALSMQRKCVEWLWSSMSLLGQGRHAEARSLARRALAGVGVRDACPPSSGFDESSSIDTPGPGSADEEGVVVPPLGLMVGGWDTFLLIFVNILVARQDPVVNNILTSSPLRGAGVDGVRLLERIKTHFDSLGSAAARVPALRPLYGLIAVMICADLCDVEMPTAVGDLWQQQDRGRAPMNGDANEFIDTADVVKSWTMASWVADNEPDAGRQLCSLVGCWSCQATRLENWCCEGGGDVAHMIDGGLIFAMKHLRKEDLRIQNNKRNNGCRWCPDLSNT